MDTKPMISVLMPVYNAERYVAEAIASVLQQSFAQFEFIIVNDGSTDGSRNVISTFNDRRIILIDQPHQGVAAALNTGLKYARANYIARFDADDICHPDRLEKQLNYLLDNSEYILVGSDVEYILENGDFLFNFQCIAHSHDQIMEKLYFYCPFIHPTVMYKKESIINAGGYATNAHNFEDYLLWTKLANAGKFHNLSEPLVKYRLNSTSVTIDEKWRGKRFRKLKRAAITRGAVTPTEADELLAIIQTQNIDKIKRGAYHALCGKKLLADNYQPAKARHHVRKAIQIHPSRLDNYLLYTVSFLPERWIAWLHKLSPNRL